MRWQHRLRHEGNKLYNIYTTSSDARWRKYCRRLHLEGIGGGSTPEIHASGISCKIVPGYAPSACPAANPAIPETDLHAVERAIRECYRVPKGSTIHWVGHDAGARGQCQCHPDKPFLGSLPDFADGKGDPLLSPKEVADLRALILVLELKKDGAKIMTAICDEHGKVPLADLMCLVEWNDLANWNPAKNRLNKKLKTKGWKLRTHGENAIAEKLPEAPPK